jgi:hypothetical protein
MAEDYTYQPIQTMAQMQARIRDLEAQLDAAIVGDGERQKQNDALWSACRELEQSRDFWKSAAVDWKGRWERVPVDELRFWWDPFTTALTAEAIDKAGTTIEAWFKAQAVQA